MFILALIMFFVGVFLSAFFSGSETGFYRASRVRMVIQALEGDTVSKYILRLINNPTLFVATTLIGNNAANYLTSLAIVLGARSVFQSPVIETLAPILLAPLLFVYGELLPKNFYYLAPNRLLRFGAPLFLFFTCVFAPAAALLWGLGRLLETVLGQSPEKVRLTIARKEVQQVLDEGEEAGILHPTQRHLGHNFFLVASKPVSEVCTPVARLHSVGSDSKIKSALKIAARHKQADLPVYQGGRTNIIGYVRTIDLLLAEQPAPIGEHRELIEVRGSELLGEALMQMQAARETLARVVGSTGQTIGVVTIDQLTDPLLKGPLDSLRR